VERWAGREWTEAKAEGGRALSVETTFDPEWVYEAQSAVASELASTEELSE
jgi:hypothetical protein